MKQRRWLRWSLWGAAATAGILLLALAGLWLWLRSALPVHDGEIVLAGLAQPVEIRFDAAGVPTIYAGDERDAAFALGYLHAGDRLFQMEFQRRLASGRLSEVVGPATVETDRMMRLFGFASLAAESFARQPPELQALLNSYSDGVNAYIGGHRGAWPPEFYLLRTEPQAWRPQDSLLWGWLMAYQLSSNWQDEWLRAGLARKLTPAQLESLWPATLPEVVEGAIDPATAWRAASAGLPGLPALSGASNSWVVAGRLTDTGHPMLANDPHLGLGLPIQWYLARIETPQGSMTGATAPGVPFMVLGQNDNVAWGLTTTVADNQDLFIETLASGQPNHYMTPLGPRPFETREETIQVRGAPDVKFTVRSTRHGPVISDIGRAAGIAGPDQVVALAWACLDGSVRTPEALYRMNRAQDAGEFRSALSLFDCPVQNIVYADRERIGFLAAGRIPVRRTLESGSQMPVPGADATYDWERLLDDLELPQRADPGDGVIATANNDIRPPYYPYFVGARFDAPYRVDRILEDIAEQAAAGPITLDGMARLQVDTLSLAARSLLPKLVELAASSPTGVDAFEAQVLDLLRDWDFRADRDAPQPLIFNAWIVRLNEALFADELGDLFGEYNWWNAETIGRVLFGDVPSDRAWCDNLSTPEPESCAVTVATALQRTLADLVAPYGKDASRWRWGQAHHAPFAHAVFSRLGPLDWLTRQDLETDGDNYTINRATALPRQDRVDFPDLHGAGYRAVYDLADPARSQFVIAGGQSGNPLSPHYADQLQRWRDGTGTTIVGDATGGRLLLRPPGEGEAAATP